MKIFLVLLTTLFCTTSFGQAPARKGHDGSGGGLVEVDGKVQSADLHTIIQKYEIPATHQRIYPELDPAIMDYLKRVVRLYSYRLNNQNKDGTSIEFQIDLKQFEFYLVDSLTGVDTQVVEDELQYSQVAHTFRVIELDQEFRVNKSRKIVELLRSRYPELLLETQAQILLHEIAHHTKLGAPGHSIISPLIKHTVSALKVAERQALGDRNRITEDEFNSSMELQRILTSQNKEFNCRKCDGSDESILKYSINRIGGGVEFNPDYSGKNNFVSMDSAVLWKGSFQKSENNTVLSSYVSIEHNPYRDNFWNFWKNEYFVASPFTNNSITNSILDLKLSSDKSDILSHNVIKNSLGTMVLKPKKGHEVTGNTIEWKSSSDQYLKVCGSKNSCIWRSRDYWGPDQILLY
jgi:hypothetical protein